MKEHARYTVTILDQSFTLTSDESQERVDSVCELINNVMAELSPTVSGSRSLLVTLVALKIANELIVEREKNSRTVSAQKSLIKLIDASIMHDESCQLIKNFSRDL